MRMFLSAQVGAALRSDSGQTRQVRSLTWVSPALRTRFSQIHCVPTIDRLYSDA